jgi:hypothetical protein
MEIENMVSEIKEMNRQNYLPTNCTPMTINGFMGDWMDVFLVTAENDTNVSSTLHTGLECHSLG